MERGIYYQRTLTVVIVLSIVVIFMLEASLRETSSKLNILDIVSFHSEST